MSYEMLLEDIERILKLKTKPNERKWKEVIAFQEAVKLNKANYHRVGNKQPGINKLCSFAYNSNHAEEIAERKRLQGEWLERHKSEMEKHRIRDEEKARLKAERAERDYVLIEYLNDSKTEWLVDYGAKRRARFAIPDIDNMTDEQIEYIREAYRFACREVNLKSLSKLSFSNIFSVTEGLTAAFCRIYKPSKECGLEKKFIRYQIHATLYELNEKE
jgi:hypothetical protein